MPLTLDASHGEGGGQVLRTALGLAVALRRAVELRGIRARRRAPGLRPQHLAVVRALARAPSSFTCPALSSHLRTVAWVAQQFLPVRVGLEEGYPAHVTVEPLA